MCYDHLAGRLAVEIADGMVRRGLLALDADGGEVTPAGFVCFDELSIDLETPRRGRRAFCRPCLDWSERRFHIAGHTGAALARHCEDKGWIKRVRDSRAVKLSEAGSEALAGLLGLTPADVSEAA